MPTLVDFAAAGFSISCFGLAAVLVLRLRNLHKRVTLIEEAAAEAALQHQQDIDDAQSLALQGDTRNGHESWRDQTL